MAIQNTEIRNDLLLFRSVLTPYPASQGQFTQPALWGWWTLVRGDDVMAATIKGEKAQYPSIV